MLLDDRADGQSHLIPYGIEHPMLSRASRFSDHRECECGRPGRASTRTKCGSRAREPATVARQICELPSLVRFTVELFSSSREGKVFSTWRERPRTNPRACLGQHRCLPLARPYSFATSSPNRCRFSVSHSLFQLDRSRPRSGRRSIPTALAPVARAGPGFAACSLQKKQRLNSLAEYVLDWSVLATNLP